MAVLKAPLLSSSPPGSRWIVYQSDESGMYEVYVSAFPKPARRLQISQAGGRLGDVKLLV
jgi:hypothetical protein